MISRRIVLTAMFAATTLAGAAWHGQALAAETPKTFRVGYQKSSAVFAIAKQQGVLERHLKDVGVEKVEWVEFQFGPPLLEALGLGSVDIGAVGDTPPIFAQSAKADLVYVSGSTTVSSGIVVPRDSEITGVEQLKGKKVAIPRGSSAHNLTVKALAKHGLTFGDIEPVYLAPADAIAAFASGNVDAWTIWDPYFALAETKHGARPIATTSDEGLNGYSYYLAHRSIAEDHPRLIEAVLEGLDEVSQWINANREEVATIHSEVTGVDRESLELAYSRYDLTLLPVDEELIASQQAIADSFAELRLIPGKIDVREYVWQAPSN